MLARQSPRNCCSRSPSRVPPSLVSRSDTSSSLLAPLLSASPAPVSRRQLCHQRRLLGRGGILGPAPSVPEAARAEGAAAEPAAAEAVKTVRVHYVRRDKRYQVGVVTALTRHTGPAAAASPRSRARAIQPPHLRVPRLPRRDGACTSGATCRRPRTGRGRCGQSGACRAHPPFSADLLRSAALSPTPRRVPHAPSPARLWERVLHPRPPARSKACCARARRFNQEDGVWWEVPLRPGARFLGMLVHAGESKSARACDPAAPLPSHLDAQYERGRSRRALLLRLGRARAGAEVLVEELGHAGEVRGCLIRQRQAPAAHTAAGGRSLCQASRRDGTSSVRSLSARPAPHPAAAPRA